MDKIGLIAPEWSLKRILSIMEESSKEIEIVPFVFNKMSDIDSILEQNKQVVSAWMLSGPLTFSYAKWYLKSEDGLVYLRITEAGLQRALLEAASQHGGLQENISLDFIEQAGNVDEMLLDLGKSEKGVYVKKYGIPFDEDELILFHKGLWESKTVRCAITTVPYVYDSLKKLGVPVYAIKATKMEILLQMELIVEKIRSSHFKNTQLGLIIVELSLYTKIVEAAGNPYKLKRSELKTQNALLNYCQQISGYLVEKGNGRYEIFGSRGKIEDNIARLRACMDEISIDLNIPTIAGIGFGETVFLAQINANKAINHARNKNGIVIFQEDSVIVEPSGKPEELSYSFSSQDKQLNERLDQANVGVRIYKKMRAIVQNAGIQTFSASQMAKQMGVTDRNVRRNLAGLEKAGLIECVGKEDSSTSGRPSKLYRFIDLNKIARQNV